MLGTAGPKLAGLCLSRRTSPVALAWFTEGFDIADLTEAKGLLDVLPEPVKIQNEWPLSGAPRLRACGEGREIHPKAVTCRTSLDALLEGA